MTSAADRKSRRPRDGGPGQAIPSDCVPPRSRQQLRLWLRLLRTTRRIETDLRRRLKAAYGITMPRFDVLAALARAPDGMTMTELSRQLVVSNGNITGIIDGLVGDRFVIRVPAPEDRRSTFVRLTPAGARYFATMAAEHAAWIEKSIGRLAPHEIEAAMVLLAKVQPVHEADGAPR